MKLLLIEDSPRLCRSIQEGMMGEGFAVDVAFDGEQGLALAETYDYDVVILDLMLPRMDGLTVLKRMRDHGQTGHVLILSAKDQVEDRIRGLDVGADDYLAKPYVFQELVARVRALLRRKYGQKNPWLELGGVRLNTADQRVFRGDEPVDLSPKEYACLELLAMHRGRVLSRDKLTNHLYDGYGDVASNVIDVMVCALRKKLHQPGAEPVIKTRRHAGYYID